MNERFILHQGALTIANIAIRQDADGRYCLNDLHRAAGGLDKDQTANFFRNAQALALLKEMNEQSSDLRTDPLKVVRGGSNPGTYVAKELVYAYAMWISPAFHLKVIRAYDQMVTQPAQAAVPALPRTFQRR